MKSSGQVAYISAVNATAIAIESWLGIRNLGLESC